MEPETIKRLVVNSIELATLLGIPPDARIVDHSQDMCLNVRKIGDGAYQVIHADYGDTITLEWEVE